MTKFQLGSLHHIGLVVPDIDKVVLHYDENLGLRNISKLYTVPEQGLKIRFVNTDKGRLEIIERANF